MIKKGILLLLLCVYFKGFATEQAPDNLLYNNLTLYLHAGWGHPSPLQTYYYQNNISYPFNMISTGNYRGHIATWVIKQDSFFLKSVDVRDKVDLPEKYGVKSSGGSGAGENGVFADWFSGVIECEKTDGKDRWKTISSFYFHIRKGVVVSMGEVTPEDIKQINQLTIKDIPEEDLLAKYKLLQLNQNYITYYYRINENDEIGYAGKQCRLNSGVERLSPVFALYSNEHLNWPYNWENMELCGPPHCTWEIVNDSLKLTGLQLFMGLRFDSIDKVIISADSLLGRKNVNGQLFADWVTGIQLFIYGADTTYGYGFKDFKPKEFIYCRIEKGIVKETYSLPASFDIKKNENDLDPRLKKLMDDYLKHL